MGKKEYWVIAVSPENETITQKLSFSPEEDDFLEGDWESFDEYVRYFLDQEVNMFKEEGYSVIQLENKEGERVFSELSTAES